MKKSQCRWLSEIKALVDACLRRPALWSATRNQFKSEKSDTHPTPHLRTILVGKQFRGASESPLKVAVHFFFLDLLKTSRVIKKNRRSVHLQKTTPSFPAAT